VNARGRGRVRRLAAGVLGAAAILNGRAEAQPQPAPLELAVTLLDAGRQRESQAGRALTALLREAGFVSARTEQAWGEMARRLGCDPGEAFDLLLGSRAMVLVRGWNDPAALDWAATSEVSERTRDAILKGVSVAPRKMVGPVQVLDVERGAMRIALRPIRPRSGPVRKGDLRHALLLGPGGSKAFDDVLGWWAKEADAFDPLADDVRIELRRQGGESLARVSCQLVAGGWDGRLEVEPAALGITPLAAERLAPWSRGPLDRLSQGALAVVIGTIEGSPEGAARGALAPPGLIMVPGELREMLAGRGLVAALEVPEGGSGIALVFAAAGDDATELAARGDRLVPRLVSHLWEGTRAVPQFGGVRPLAARAIRFEPRREAPAWLGAMGETAAAAWGVCGSAPGDAAWWVFALAPAIPGRLDSEVLRQVCEALTSAGEGEPRLRVSMGALRPARFVAWAERRAGGPHDATGLLRRIEAIDWDLWLEPGGLLAGEASLRLAIPQDGP
jgi:hypothetical protein